MKYFFLFILLALSLYAHPHTFIDVYTQIDAKNSNTSIIHFKWQIDEMTSSMLILDVDTNNDGELDIKESNFIEENYFNIFKDYNYYTYIKVKEKNIPFKNILNFKASIENHKVCYSFDIIGDFPLKDTIIEFGDSDFYVAMVVKKEFLNLKGIIATITDVDNDFYYGYRLEFK